MTEAMTDETCLDSITHAGSCCEGGRRPFSQRKEPICEKAAEDIFPAYNDPDDTVGYYIIPPSPQVDVDAIKAIAEGTDSLLAERAKDYGPPEINMTGIGLIWTAQLRNHYGMADLPVLSGQMVALMMAGLKLNRLAKSPGHQDSYDDLEGYAEIAKRLTPAQEASDANA
jgi:hypothetical protein